MRLLNQKEKTQRGCIYCTHMIKKKVMVTKYPKPKYGSRTHCEFDECPYKQLDKYKDYEQYFKEHQEKVDLDKYFHTQYDSKKLLNNAVKL